MRRSVRPVEAPAIAAEPARAHLAERPPAPATILDIAAGHGLYGITCARQFPAARVTAVDRTRTGLDDLVVGAGPGAGPQVSIISGQTLTPVASFMAYDPLFTGGVFVG